MAESVFAVGQRWVSHSEAELGLGLIKEDSGRRIKVIFPAVGEERTYAADNAPLSRVIYNIDDAVETESGVRFSITARHEINDCYFYHGTDEEGNEVGFHELDLSSHVQFSQPQDRLFAGQIDKNRQFELRTEALYHQHRLAQATTFGLMGPRVQLLPHQLYIAHQVSQRVAPRVLLADEVGLGKTIEAGMIIHQQLLTGRADRVLIIVPDSLLHQWLVELLRRFNLAFTIMDEERYQSLVEADEGNPFDSAQLLLCPLSFLTQTPQAYQAAHQADWDLMVVDEAHHLHWSEAEVSPEYACIEGLASRIAGLLLLTATPEQLGVESHFARLKLLDPDRYYDLAAFQQQEAEYGVVNALVTQLIDCDDIAAVTPLLPELTSYIGDEAVSALQHADDFEEAKQTCLQALLDLHGTGRILFRNTRDGVAGFPQRIFHPHPLLAPDDYISANTEMSEQALVQAEQSLGADWLKLDPRVSWLVDWLNDHRDEKVLVICAQSETAQDLEQALRLQYGKRSTVFHEGLSLVNRDRAAAYFADDEDGAQVMICSEIGSEGRNFQFSHHLVLFDLPLNPDLLEQRIGRLDRIGQLQDVHIHCPYYTGSAQEKLSRWYHEGLNAFEQVCTIGGNVYQQVEDRLIRCLKENDDNDFTALLSESQTLAQSAREQLASGRNRLLELNSCNTAVANEVIAELESAGQSQVLSSFMDKVFDAYGVEHQEHSADSIILSPGTAMLDSHFPSLDEEGMTATFHRHKALHREDMDFLSWEHPMVLGSLDMICHSDFGNTAFCTLDYPDIAEGTLLLEAIFTMHVVAPKSLQAQRYLPAAYIRIVTDNQGRDFHDVLDEVIFNQSVGRIPRITKQALVKRAKPMIEQLVEQAKGLAQKQQQSIIKTAQSDMQHDLQQEQQRLTQLAKVNAAIREDEMHYLAEKEQLLASALSDAQLTLDAVRVAIVAE